MKNVCNWFFGSFFRTLGRVLVYLFIGYILSILLQNFKILPNDFSFGFTNVHALSAKLDGTNITNTSYLYRSEGNRRLRIDYLSNDDIVCSGSCENTQYYLLMVCTGLESINSYYTNEPTGSKVSTFNYVYSNSRCYYPNSNPGVVAYYYGKSNPGVSVSGGTAAPYVDYTFYAPTSFSISLLGLYFSDSPFDYDFSTNTIITQNNELYNRINNASNTAHNDAIDTKNAINDQTNTLKDDSIDDNGTSSFVSGLQNDYSSLTPFSDFINLPLTWIQSLLASNQSCTDIELPLPFVNQNLTLPCMTSFWERMGVLGTLIQLVWIAVVGVRIFNGLFLLTCDSLDPNPDKDMTRLRTWEL